MAKSDKPSANQFSIHNWSQPQWIKLLLAVGILLRLYPYLQNRALWLDEAMLANNIVGRSFAQLAQPLADNQSAPLGQLWLTKLLCVIAGNSEYILRLPSLIAGILALFLFHRLSQKLFEGRWVVWAMAFFVFCDPHIYYSSELKQYAFDVLLTLSILLATLPLLNSTWSRGQLLQLGILGVLAIWFSQPAIFVLAGAGLSLLALHYRHPAKRWPILGWGALWLLSFGVYYVFLLADSIGNAHLQDYHSAYFMPWKFWEFPSWEWYSSTYFRLFRNPAGVLFKYLAGAFGLVGFFVVSRWWRRRWLLLFGPLALAVAASGLQMYSTLPRLLLFAVPILLIAMIKGWRSVYEWVEGLWSSPWPGRLVILTGALLLLQPVLNGIQRFTTPNEVEAIKLPLQHIADQRQAGDLLYLYPTSLPAFNYYKKRYGLVDMPTLIGESPWEDWQLDLQRLRPHRRVWLLFAHDKEASAMDQQRYKDFLEKNGQIKAEVRGRGSGCFLLLH